MIFKHFRAGIIWRILVIATAATASVFLWIQYEYIFSAIIVSVFSVSMILNLIYYVEKTNEKLIRFLNGVRFNDFSLTFADNELGSSFRDLNQAFNRIIEQFKSERADRQESVRYLETVVHHVGVGLLVFNNRGEVTLFNITAKRMLNIPGLIQINALREIQPKLYDTITKLRGGERSLVSFHLNNSRHQWAVHAAEFVMHETNYKMVSLQNISGELEEKEMEAWQNLTQVLAHEIMNSITPIASLSETVHSFLSEEIEKGSDNSTIDNETVQDVDEALTTIKNRSYGLMRFVQSYRDFTQIPQPDLQRVRVNELLNRIHHLMKGEFKKQGVEIHLDTDPETLTVLADPQLIEQVLINLTKNALRALKSTDHPVIKYIGCLDDHGRITIRINDNGPGIDKELQDKIFIPFYTNSGTDSAKGTGIGLSLSRQIMRLHNGGLFLETGSITGTTFIMRF